ncbi:MAG: GyrI-like domain-containing protein [Clostridia bacterium]|nr:GyrI-like domain-containing protein [Clostridia bacterium]MCI1998924.1 GyrI-like domain-containing protein [Clostridia bacterium]MCI2013674.1 GyrI-like domain-containing protein [Clostridia bacterium]
MSMNIEIIPPYEIAYFRHFGPYGIENAQTMENLKQWAKLHNLFNDKTIIFGIAQDNPDTMRPENCRYDACIVISHDYCISDDIAIRGNIAGGRYAVFKIDHTAEAVQQAWSEIFQRLSEYEYQVDETRPIMERYKVEMVKKHFCEICVPIKSS